jgi:hypothetical protein
VVTALTHDQRVAKLLALTADVEDFDDVERIWARGLAVDKAVARFLASLLEPSVVVERLAQQGGEG